MKETMTEYILNIDWMTTTEFCREHKVPLPTASEGVEGLLRIDAVKHRMFVEYAKKLQKEAKNDVITPESLEELGFEDAGSRCRILKVGYILIIVDSDGEVAIELNRSQESLPSCKTLTDLKHLIRILGV